MKYNGDAMKRIAYNLTPKLASAVFQENPLSTKVLPGC